MISTVSFPKCMNLFQLKWHEFVVLQSCPCICCLRIALSSYHRKRDRTPHGSKLQSTSYFMGYYRGGALSLKSIALRFWVDNLNGGNPEIVPFMLCLKRSDLAIFAAVFGSKLSNLCMALRLFAQPQCCRQSAYLEGLFSLILIIMWSM